MNSIQKRPSLPICIVMDLIGYATYALPFIGEIGDMIWAPVSGLIFINYSVDGKERWAVF